MYIVLFLWFGLVYLLLKCTWRNMGYLKMYIVLFLWFGFDHEKNAYKDNGSKMANSLLCLT
jgi:hypothetical protein